MGNYCNVHPEQLLCESIILLWPELSLQSGTKMNILIGIDITGFRIIISKTELMKAWGRLLRGDSNKMC